MLTLATTALLAGSLNAAPLPVAYEVLVCGTAHYHVVTADLRSERLTAATVHTQRLASVWDMIRRSRPIAAITGTFFAPGTQIPVGDVLVDGKLVARGSRGTAIGVSYYGGVRIFDAPYRKAVDWGEYQFGLRGTVRVLSAGKVSPDPKSQSFKDSSLWGRAARTGIGVTRAGKVLLVATTQKVTLSELGRALRSLGARDGISLDGGGSTCLYYRGSLIVPPLRKLSNLFVISDRSAGL